MKFFNSKKLMAGLAIGFGIAAITSTALAAYVITGGSRKDDDNNIKPTEVVVKNNVVNLTATLQPGELLLEDKAQVNKGRVTTTEAGKLALKIDIVVTATSPNLLGDVSFTATPTYTDNNKNNQIGTYFTFSAETITKDTLAATGVPGAKDEPNTYKATADLVWAWTGDYKEHNGIAAYYNAHPEIKDADVITGMNAFRDTVNNISNYTITVKMAEPAPLA